MDNKQIIISIVIMAMVTAAIRFLPFLIFDSENPPKIILSLGKALPFAMMGMLVVYCLKDITFDAAKNFVPEVIAGIIVVTSYYLKKNTILSVILGTGVYMLLVQFVFK